MVGTKTITCAGRTLTNHNKLLWRYDGCIGVKTGYTRHAGRILVSAAERGESQLIAVTLADPDDWRDHAALLDYGFAVLAAQTPVYPQNRRIVWKNDCKKFWRAAPASPRRKAEELIADGRVRVNGNTARLGEQADGMRTSSSSTASVSKRGRSRKKIYRMLCKPRGFVTTMHDEKGRRTVADLVADLPERVYPVGRLDLNSEGLLLLTNDGELANRLMHPKKQVDKTYLVWVSSYIAGSERSLAQPIGIDGRMTSQPRRGAADQSRRTRRAAPHHDPRGPQPADPPPG